MRGIATICIQTNEFMVGYFIETNSKKVYNLISTPSTNPPKVHDCYLSEPILFWDIQIKLQTQLIDTIVNVQQLYGHDLLNLSSTCTDDIQGFNSNTTILDFSCDLLKVDSDADDILKQWFPKLMGLDVIVCMGRMNLENSNSD
ncbi:hypothetical protein BC833DRAFT_421883 [Globomyces pollinis-pini]|nr:hypothetical protein BC833DRAFT_421883 [Globomyces pollinis-pini]